MMNGLIGKKLGMTQIFAQDGKRVPVTILRAGPCVILQKKTIERDGYNAIQVGFEQKPAQPPYCNKPMLGHFIKAGKGAFRKIAEFTIDNVEEFEKLTVGQEINLSLFAIGDRISITGTSKGRGFQGVMKRHNFAGGRATHGSMSHRRPGSIGQCAYPSRVFRGHRMGGQMGNKRITVRNLEIIEVDEKNNLLMVKGAVPGANNNFVLIRRK